MICIRSERGRSCVVAVCDCCLESIDAPNAGLYIWRRDGEPLVLLHKGACDRRWVAANGGSQAWPFSGELDDLPVYLGANLGREWPGAVLEELPTW